MSGHKGEEYRSGGKLISVVLALVAAAFAALCILQLFGGEVSYRTIKTWQLRAALTEISRNIEKEDLDMRVARLSSGGIETRIVDEQGLDLLEPQSVCENSLAEYSQQELTTLCDKDSISSGAIWEQTTRFNAPPNTGDRKKKLFWKEHEGRRIMTCANMVSLQDGSPVLVLVRSAITPSRTTTRVLRVQIALTALAAGLCVLMLALALRQRRNRQIKKLTRQAQLLKSEPKAVFSEQGSREIRELGQALNHAMQNLSQTEQLRQELVANISHDLRAPLTMILGYAEVMRDIPEENTPENVQIIMDEAQRLSFLVNDILELSKLSSGNRQLHRKTFCLTDLLSETVERFQRLTAHQGCRIQLEKDCRVWVRADELEISRVVYNLINNAIQHAGKKKEITVIQRLQDRRVCVCVRDNGAGIREEQLCEIWNRYYRADKNQQDQPLSGSGLGLCIVREILQQHGAQYGVESKLGEGSTFWFALDALDINK